MAGQDAGPETEDIGSGGRGKQDGSHDLGDADKRRRLSETGPVCFRLSM